MLTHLKVGATPVRRTHRRTHRRATPSVRQGNIRIPVVGGAPPRNPGGRKSRAGGSNNGSKKNNLFVQLQIEELFKLLLDDLLTCVYEETYLSMKNIKTSTIRLTIGNSLKRTLAGIIETQFNFDKVLVMRTIANFHNVTMIPGEYAGRKALRSFTKPICNAMKRIAKNQLNINAVSTFINL